MKNKLIKMPCLLTKIIQKIFSIFFRTLFKMKFANIWTFVRLIFYFIFSNKKYFIVNGLKITAPSKQIVIARVLDNFLEYDLYFDKLELKNVKTILDIGSNIGSSTIYFRSRYSQSTIYSFEPVPKVIALFKQNINNNKLKNIYLNEFGLSNKQGIVNIYVEEQRLNMNSIDPKFSGGVKQKIKIRKLSDFIRQNNINKIDIMKVDVEGSEGRILQDMIDNNLMQKVNILLIEVRNDNMKIFNKLKKNFMIIDEQKEWNPYDKELYYQILAKNKRA